jgi:hypothetical protein
LRCTVKHSFAQEQHAGAGALPSRNKRGLIFLLLLPCFDTIDSVVRISKIFGANHIFSAIRENPIKTIHRSFKKIETMHTNSASIDMHCDKI